jgi:UDP-GlcNAc:undecaprenyl-phosphate/decaprenyl-phosphate GlcNAc-1-phosphate transferase
MDYSLELFWVPLLAAATVAASLAPLVIRLYRKYNWLDDPQGKTHKKVIHTYPVPRGGGLVIFGALLLCSLFFMGIDRHTLAILLGALILTVVGVVDDVKDSHPYWRLLWGFTAALVVVGAGIGITFITNPFGEGVIALNWWWLADIMALVWIVWCMNMINWSKGLDGQLPGMVVIAATVIAMLSFRFTEDVTHWEVSLLAAITAGAYLGFLPYNLFPQRMMPGYGGGTLAGYLLAVLSILSGSKLATLMIVLAVPMLDAFYVILRRLAHGKSPVWGDTRHLHHKLLELGWSKRKIAGFYWLVTFMFGLIALQLNASQKAFTILLISLGFGAGLLWLNFFITSSNRRGRASG